MLGTEELGLLGEANQIIVGFQELFGAGGSKSPVHRVDEVECRMGGDELEHSMWDRIAGFHE
jgi:hypothetical protein